MSNDYNVYLLRSRHDDTYYRFFIADTAASAFAQLSIDIADTAKSQLPLSDNFCITKLTDSQAKAWRRLLGPNEPGLTMCEVLYEESRR